MTFLVYDTWCNCYHQNKLVPWVDITRVGTTGDLWMYERKPNLFDDLFSFELGTLEECKRHVRRDMARLRKLEKKT